jgi:hypothetical protein
MKPAPRRHHLSGHLALSDTTALRSRQEVTLETVFAPESDGLAAWFLHTGPDTGVLAPDPAPGGGQYVLVAAGSLQYNGETFPSLSCVYVSREEKPLSLQAGPAGLEALILQFPHPAASPPTTPPRDDGRR